MTTVFDSPIGDISGWGSAIEAISLASLDEDLTSDIYGPLWLAQDAVDRTIGLLTFRQQVIDKDVKNLNKLPKVERGRVFEEKIQSLERRHATIMSFITYLVSAQNALKEVH